MGLDCIVARYALARRRARVARELTLQAPIDQKEKKREQRRSLRDTHLDELMAERRDRARRDFALLPLSVARPPKREETLLTRSFDGQSCRRKESRGAPSLKRGVERREREMDELVEREGVKEGRLLSLSLDLFFFFSSSSSFDLDLFPPLLHSLSLSLPLSL